MTRSCLTGCPSSSLKLKRRRRRKLNFLLMGLQRHIQSVKPRRKINVLSDPQFYCLQNVCDSYYHKLHTMGVETEKRVTEVFDANDEDKLWSSGILDIDIPQGLLNALFWSGFMFVMDYVYIDSIAIITGV